jgi:putative hydrolase of the HAD superfamily
VILAPQRGTRVVLFDLGGVLFELGGVADFGRMIGESRPERIWETWNSNPWVRAFERGECDRSRFAEGLVDSLRLLLEPDAFLARFASWLVGPFAGAEALVRLTARAVSVGCVSNTNDVHWPLQAACSLVGAFEHVFLSHQLGLVKPDRSLFERVVEASGHAPEAILFLDDIDSNVAAARAAGIDAHLAVGVDGAREVLAMRGIVPPG